MDLIEYKEFEYFLQSLKLKKESLKKLEVWELEYILIRAEELYIKMPLKEINDIIEKKKENREKAQEELKKLLEKKKTKAKIRNGRIIKVNVLGKILYLKRYKRGEIYIENDNGTYSKLKKKEFRKKHKLGYEQFKKIFYNELGEI